MKQLIIRRALAAVPVLLIVTLLAFSLLYLLPGDRTMVLIGEDQAVSPEVMEKLRHDLGLDRPFIVQYVSWLADAVRGDLGKSIATHLPIAEEIKNRIPVTLELGILASLVSLVIAIPVGVISAARPNSFADASGTFFAMAGVAMPNFWLGMLLILLFAVTLGWLPSIGYVPIWEDPVDSLRRMIMPAIALGTSHSASLMRQTRSAMLEVLNQDYIRTAHAKGLAGNQVLIRHALRNALIPVCTVFGLQTSRLIGGTVIVESLFGLPGIGKFAVDSIQTRDFLVLQGVLLLVGVWVLLFNLLTDIAYAIIDPRIRYNK